MTGQRGYFLRLLGWSGYSVSGPSNRTPQAIASLAKARRSGGLGDSFTAGVAHREDDGRAVLDCLVEKTPPFDPATATKEIAAVLKSYGVATVTGDKYAPQWPVAEFARSDITYEHSERDRSAIYADFLPLLTSGRARLLDSPRLVGQLANLERKTAPMGRDRIDHPPGAHDDLSNAAAGALALAAEESSYWARGMSWVGDPDHPEPEVMPYGQRPLFHHPAFGRLPWLR